MRGSPIAAARATVASRERIIHDDHAKPLIALGQDTPKRVLDEVLMLVGRDHHRDVGVAGTAGSERRWFRPEKSPAIRHQLRETQPGNDPTPDCIQLRDKAHPRYPDGLDARLRINGCRPWR